MTDPFLNPAELARLTCRKLAPAQAKMLDRMGIPYRLDGEGKPLVLRTAAFGSNNQAPQEPAFHLL